MNAEVIHSRIISKCYLFPVSELRETFDRIPWMIYFPARNGTEYQITTFDILVNTKFNHETRTNK